MFSKTLNVVLKSVLGKPNKFSGMKLWKVRCDIRAWLTASLSARPFSGHQFLILGYDFCKLIIELRNDS